MNDYHHKPLHFCVLLPCYNDETGLVQALKSIQYPFDACLAVVVDDGSTKPLDKAQLEAMVGTGLQVHVLRLPHNQGITAALNAGLDWIVTHTSAPYIARLDCRDLCDGERFFAQIEFLNVHSQVGLLGTWCRFQEEGNGLAYTYETPVHHTGIEKAMPLRNVFIHPTVMFRTALIKGGERYPYQYPHAEDYAFFWRLLQVTEGAILPRLLVTCAINRSGISYSYRKEQLLSRQKVIETFAGKGWNSKLGQIKIYLLLLVPKTVLLRLKGLKDRLYK